MNGREGGREGNAHLLGGGGWGKFLASESSSSVMFDPNSRRLAAWPAFFPFDLISRAYFVTFFSQISSEFLVVFAASIISLLF